MKGTKTIALICFAAILMLTSCVTPRRVNYLQDMTQGSQIELENKFEARIAPYDDLSITVTNPMKPELAQPFNMNNFQANYGNNVNRGYLVDVNGDIDLPIIGKLHVAGLTRLELQDTLTHIFNKGELMTDPFVMVRFNNFKIFFLGANGGKVINVANERCTFLEALAMSGDLSIYTRRDHIAVMREVDGHMVMRYLDPRSSNVFNDPFFMLQQNDFIITEGVDNGVVRSEVAYWLGWAGTIISTATMITTILLYQKMQNN